MKLSRISRLILLTGAAFVVVFPLAGQEKPKVALGHASIAQLETDLPGLMRESEIPGLTIATVSRGKLDWHGNFGVKNSKTGELVTDQTIFEAASLSKPVFAYAALKLVDQGKL